MRTSVTGLSLLSRFYKKYIKIKMYCSATEVCFVRLTLVNNHCEGLQFLYEQHF